MRALFSIVLTLLLLLFNATNSLAEDYLDSLKNARIETLNAYTEFDEAMETRTWINLLELNRLANDVIQSDKDLIDALQANLKYYKQLTNEEIEELKMEVAVLSKEKELQGEKISEQQKMNQYLLIAAGTSLLFFIVTLVLFFNNSIRLKNTRIELEKLWSIREEPQAKKFEKDEVSLISEQMDQLADENKRLKDDLKQTSGQKSEALEALKEEIKNRRQIEKEIKDLIAQLKSH